MLSHLKQLIREASVIFKRFPEIPFCINSKSSLSCYIISEYFQNVKENNSFFKRMHVFLMHSKCRA